MRHMYSDWRPLRVFWLKDCPGLKAPSYITDTHVCISKNILECLGISRTHKFVSGCCCCCCGRTHLWSRRPPAMSVSSNASRSPSRSCSCASCLFHTIAFSWGPQYSTLLEVASGNVSEFQQLGFHPRSWFFSTLMEISCFLSLPYYLCVWPNM